MLSFSEEKLKSTGNIPSVGSTVSHWLILFSSLPNEVSGACKWEMIFKAYVLTLLCKKSTARQEMSAKFPLVPPVTWILAQVWLKLLKGVIGVPEMRNLMIQPKF